MPKGADNSTLIIDAARDLFLERGFAATSMDTVAQAAGVSKATVYAQFGSKAQLFAAMVEREGEQQTLALNSLPDGATTEVLQHFGRVAAELLLSHHVVAMQRIVTSEATRTPGIGDLFFINGPEHLIDTLAAFLDRAMRRGDLRAASPRLAAAQFLAIIVADLQFRALVGVGGRSTARQRNQVAASGVDVFLRGYAPERAVSLQRTSSDEDASH